MDNNLPSYLNSELLSEVKTHTFGISYTGTEELFSDSLPYKIRRTGIGHCRLSAISGYQANQIANHYFAFVASGKECTLPDGFEWMEFVEDDNDIFNSFVVDDNHTHPFEGKTDMEIDEMNNDFYPESELDQVRKFDFNIYFVGRFLCNDDKITPSGKRALYHDIDPETGQWFCSED